MIDTNSMWQNPRVQLELNNSVNIELMGVTSCPPGWTGYEHSHPFWEVVYISNNQNKPFTFIINGEHTTFHSPVIALMPPNTTHQFHNDSDINVANMYVGFSFSLDPYTRTKSDIPLFLPDQDPDTKYMMSVFNEIVYQPLEIVEQLLFSKRINILEAIIHLSKHIIENDNQGQSFHYDRAVLLVNKVKDYISQNLVCQISVKEIANELYISPNYLGQVFRQITGMTVKDYHNRLRLKYSISLLSEGTHTINEIAYLLGYESAAYFSRRFKDMYGVSPVKFIK